VYKKLLIASAATLLASSAFAQSSVTLYGLIDTAVQYQTRAGTTAYTDGEKLAINQGQFNGSRWGMRGSEDLGSGLKAVFKLESGFTPDDGKSGQGGLLFGRQAYVGLSSNAGTVTLGRQYTPTFNFAGDFDPIGISNEGETSAYLNYAAFRENNSINYEANFSGLGIQAMYGMGEVAGSNRTGTLMGARLGYSIAGFGIGAVYQQNNNNGTAVLGSTAADVKNIGVGASYAIGPVKLFANWLNTKNVAGISGNKSNFYTLGANYLVTPQVNLIAAGYYDKTSISNLNGSRYTVMGSAQYLLSKRTTVYASVDFTKEKNNYDSTVPGSLANSPAALGNYAGTRTNLMLGLRHAF